MPCKFEEDVVERVNSTGEDEDDSWTGKGIDGTTVERTTYGQ